MLIPITSGLAVPVVLLSAITDLADVQSASASEATITLQADGDIVTYTTADGTLDIGDWIAPKSAAGANYEARVTVNSGSLTTGTTGSWLSLGSDRTWGAVDLVGDLSPVAANVTIEIRRASGGAALASQTFNITVDYGE